MLGTSENEPVTLDEEARKTHLLVVEDEPTLRELFASLLASAGFSVAQARDGFDALEELRRRRPALILSDLNMPRMTGFELLSVIRRRFPAIHVIAMSGAFAGEGVPTGVAADAFYEKNGRHIGTLVQVIQEILRTPRDAAEQAETQKEGGAVALWVTQLGAPITGPYLLLTCMECLRSFPHPVREDTAMHLRETPCVFCRAAIRYAMLESTLPPQQGYAPTAAG